MSMILGGALCMRALSTWGNAAMEGLVVPIRLFYRRSPCFDQSASFTEIARGSRPLV
jgi:hypothetical protein